MESYLTVHVDVESLKEVDPTHPAVNPSTAGLEVPVSPKYLMFCKADFFNVLSFLFFYFPALFSPDLDIH